LSVTALDLDLADTQYNTLVAGIGRFSSFAGVGGKLIGLAKTTDGGTTWTPIGGTLVTDTSIASVAVRGNTIMAASAGNTTGLFRSTDGGTTFKNIAGTVGLPEGAFKELAKDPSNPANFYVTVLGEGIYRSVELFLFLLPFSFSLLP
jgi:hypothetical protein